MNVEMAEKISGHTGIFRGDQFHFLQEAKSACADVLEIANRRSNEIQDSHSPIVSQKKTLFQMEEGRYDR